MFDLDHTLLSGDSDMLLCGAVRCAFLNAKHLRHQEKFAARNTMGSHYKADTVGLPEGKAMHLR